MTVVNLSDELKKQNRSLITRIKMWRTPDIYWASSLSKMDDYFRKSRPNIFDDDICGPLDVFIWMHNIEAKIDDEIEDERTGKPELALISLRDITGDLVTLYKVNDQQVYREVKNKFGLNYAVHVPIPEILLRYMGIGNLGAFTIASFGSHDRPRRVDDSLLDKLYNLIPEQPRLAYQLGYSHMVA